MSKPSATITADQWECIRGLLGTAIDDMLAYVEENPGDYTDEERQEMLDLLEEANGIAAGLDEQIGREQNQNAVAGDNPQP